MAVGTGSHVVMQQSLLLLEYDPSLVPPNGGVQQYKSIACFSKNHGKDAAGHVFHDFALKQAGLYDWPEDVSEEDVSSNTPLASQSSASLSSMADDQPPPGVQWKGKGKKKKKQDKDTLDMYGLLGLQNERYLATEGDIKNAYRKMALELHPDKCSAGIDDPEKKQVIEDRFKQLQEAYEILSNPTKRREYDSTDVFDDTLPTDCDPADFFKVFGPAFRRNSRWSSVTPVPDVGDDTTPYDKVEAFYKFWYQFKSWREFPHPDEEDVEQAESREHARYIKRYNTKLREKGKKEEKLRLKEFIEAAYKCDPRIIRRREEERQKREQKRLDREAAERRKAEEEERAREEEAARKAAEEVRQAELKKQRQQEKKALQKERGRLRGLTTGSGAVAQGFDEDDVERLCSKMALEDMRALCMLLGDPSQVTQQQAAFQDALARVGAQEAAEKAEKAQATAAVAAQQEAMKAKAAENKAAARAEWTDDEIRMLQKAVNKFPVGTAKRWETIAAYVRTRTVEEVIDMVKHGLQAGKLAPKDDQWKLQVKKNAPVINSAPDARMAAFSDVDVNIQGAAAQALQTPHTAATTNGATPAPAAPAADACAPTAAPQQQDAAAAAATAAWTEEQEVALVKALKQVDKAAADRWEQVAVLVPGKTKAQCFKRFKELKENFKQKKAAV